jgi:hypothetical protein
MDEFLDIRSLAVLKHAILLVFFECGGGGGIVPLVDCREGLAGISHKKMEKAVASWHKAFV